MSELFCEKCGSMMLPKGKVIVCSRCKTEKEILYRDNFKLVKKSEKKRKLLIVDEEIQTLPTVKTECKKCKNTIAEWWLLQTRKADESETRFFRCTKCKFTWREYN
jgi:DNA-directed RNA polymerase subunit M|tara:strand:+ start:356 stop:673 length:318 start_codon:yes stop_codon:yes gene_type:complete